VQTANTSLGKRRRVLSLSAVGFCARTRTRIKQQTQADSLGSLRLSGVQKLFHCNRSKMINSSALAASPGLKRSCLFDAPLFVARSNTSAARVKTTNSSLALAASHRPPRSCLFDAPLFVAPTPPLHHPMLSTASVRLPNKTNSLPISDRQKINLLACL